MDSTSANRSPEEFLLAFEIGGTTLTAAAADRRCRLLGPLVKARTNTSNDLLEELFGLGDRVLRGTDRPGPPLAIGIASKGPIDHTTGAVLSASLPSLWNLNLPARFTERFGVPAYVDNNANCVALGEVTAGAGRGVSSAVCVTLGTGFGCGIVLDGRVLQGSTRNAGELEYCRLAGQMFDDVLSGPGVSRLFREISGRDGVEPQRVAEMAESGDSEALRCWDIYGKKVGTALGLICALLDPQICIVGGSVALSSRFFFDRLQAELQSHLAPQVKNEMKIALATLGSEAGVIGAAAYACERLPRSTLADVQ